MAEHKMPEKRLGQQASPPFMISPPGCNFTPDEVGRMLANRVVQPHYAEWLVRKALECHGADAQALQAEVERLRASIGAIHCMAGRVDASVICSECEHAVPGLAAMKEQGR
jgi:hypothetical protein